MKLYASRGDEEQKCTYCALRYAMGAVQDVFGLDEWGCDIWRKMGPVMGVCVVGEKPGFSGSGRRDLGRG